MRLWIEVHDASSVRPVLREVAVGDEHGRGLMLVRSLSQEWGCHRRPLGIGKVVWSVITPDEVAGRAAVGALGPVVVELTGITGPAEFTRLPDALAALWESMKVLPLCEEQYLAYELFLTRPDAVERAAEFLQYDGRLELSFGLADGPHLLRVRWAGSRGL